MSSGISRQLRTEPLALSPPSPPQLPSSYRPFAETGDSAPHGSLVLTAAGVLRGDLTQPGMCSGGAHLGAGCVIAWRRGCDGGS